MDNYRLKVRLGDFEFDAEGPPEVVKDQFLAFQEMVSKLPSLTVPPTPPAAPTHGHEAPPPPADQNGHGATRTDPQSVDASLGKIMRVDDRVVSLTVPPQVVDDAVLLLLYGQRVLRNNESVTGAEIVEGVTSTGGLDMGRSDRLLERLARSGDVIMIGERRGKRYRLTNTGLNKARQVAAGLIALVA